MNNLALAPVPQHPAMQAATDFTAGSLILDVQRMQAMHTFAVAMSEATIAVPSHFRGKPGDCLAVVMQATAWGMNPFAVAQKTHVVNGALGYEAQLVNAVVQQSGAIDGRFHYEYQDKPLACRVGAVIRGEKEITWGEWLTADSVTTKNSPLWKTNPRQQLGYLQVKNWSRAYVPGAILGVYTADELEAAPERDMGIAEVVEKPASRTDAVKTLLNKDKAATLSGVLDAIAKACTLDELAATVDAAGKLPNGDKATARQAYLLRKDDLTEPAQESGPGLSDALLAIQAGDLDMAADIARRLPEDQAQQVDAAILAALDSAK